MSEYIPKSSGESFIKRALGKRDTFKAMYEKKGKKFIPANTISIPVKQAEEIIENYDSRGPAIRSALKILEELQSQLNGQYQSYSPTTLRSLCDRAIFHIKKVK